MIRWPASGTTDGRFAARGDRHPPPRSRRSSPTTRASAITGVCPSERPPLGAVKDGEWSYIRREGDVHEELFHLREDAKEMRNLAGDPAAQTILQQMRAALDRLTGGPLLPSDSIIDDSLRGSFHFFADRPLHGPA